MTFWLDFRSVSAELIDLAIIELIKENCGLQVLVLLASDYLGRCGNSKSPRRFLSSAKLLLVVRYGHNGGCHESTCCQYD